MKWRIFIFLGFVFRLNLYAEDKFSFGIKLNTGVSEIANSYTFKQFTKHDKLAPSFNFGVSFVYNINKYSALRSELLFTQINGVEKLSFDMIDKGINYGWVHNTFERNISFLSMPLLYEINSGKFFINIGVQPMMLLLSANTGVIEINLLERYSTYNSGGAVYEIKRFNAGYKIGIGYNLKNNFAIESSFYNNATTILVENKNNNRWNIMQVTVGIRYDLFSTKNIASPVIN